MQIIRTTCNRDCPDSCSILVTVEDGRVTKQRGDPEHPITQGFLCQRGNRYLDRFYSAERILHPQRRTPGGWERVSWDDALDWTADRLQRARQEDGPLSVLSVSYSGIKGLVARTLGRLFWAHFGGATFTRGGTSVEASHAAQALDFGRTGTHAPEDLANSRAFVVWGKNIAVTRPHVMPFVNRARKAGAELVVIDPVYCSTARRADLHLAIRPGSDAMLAIGIARILLESGAVDKERIAVTSNGFDRYRRLVTAVPLDEVCAATDLAPPQIERLAKLYAETRPLATLIGLGPSYWRHSGTAVRLIDALAFISGNIGIPGGGAHTDTNSYAGLNFSILDDAPTMERRSIRMPRIGDEILAARDPKLRAGFVAGANPAATSPDTGRTIEALDSLETLVVVEQFMTATAERADLVLPCTTYLEMDDLVVAYGHHWLGTTQAVVEPLGEAKSDAEIYQQLADRLGFGPALEGESRLWMERILGELGARGITPKSLAERPVPNPLEPEVPFADGRLDTPTGRFDFITELPDLSAAGSNRLQLMATKTLKMVNAQINSEELPDEPTVRLHPETLHQRGFEPGARAWVVSEVGRVRAKIEVDRQVRRDVLLFNPAAWRGDLQGVNQLRRAVVADMGDAAAMHETEVTLER